jgi:superfamily II DNA or RNA helicase
MLVALVADAMTCIPPITNAGLSLRDYQYTLKHDVFDAWRDGALDVCAVSPTGSGKTRTSGSIVHEFTNAGIPVVISAHRQELVGQLSLAMAAEGIYHNIIASRSTIRFISNRHMEKLGRSFYHPTAIATVSSVDTLIRRQLGPWADSVGLYLTDEAHHLLAGNKWGKARAMFPNALGLGVTATPDRADGRGLGRHADGVFDVLVRGPEMRDLIRQGFLTDYRIFCPPTDLDLATVAITQGGDYNKEQLGAASRKSHIVGDVVEHYCKIAFGKKGVTFAIDVEDAHRIADAFNEAGVPAVALSSDNTDTERAEALDRFERGELWQLVNVDLFGEGFDLPAIEVVSFARPTQSYSLYVQQFGRALRLFLNKTHAIIIDHVGNVQRFISQGRGLPDTPQQWTLDRREKRGKSKATPGDVLKLTTCHECFAAYESSEPSCPWCGAVPAVAAARGPDRIDGDLAEMPADLLALLRGERERIDESPESVKQRMLAAGAPQVVALSAAKAVRVRAESQSTLRTRIALWGAQMEAAGLSVGESQIEFKREFGIDVLSAQVLGTREATELSMRVMVGLVKMGLTVE